MSGGHFELEDAIKCYTITRQETTPNVKQLSTKYYTDNLMLGTTNQTEKQR